MGFHFFPAVQQALDQRVHVFVCAWSRFLDKEDLAVDFNSLLTPLMRVGVRKKPTQKPCKEKKPSLLHSAKLSLISQSQPVHRGEEKDKIKHLLHFPNWRQSDSLTGTRFQRSSGARRDVEDGETRGRAGVKNVRQSRPSEKLRSVGEAEE